MWFWTRYFWQKFLVIHAHGLKNVNEMQLCISYTCKYRIILLLTSTCIFTSPQQTNKIVIKHKLIMQNLRAGTDQHKKHNHAKNHECVDEKNATHQTYTRHVKLHLQISKRRHKDCSASLSQLGKSYKHFSNSLKSNPSQSFWHFLKLSIQPIWNLE